MIYSEHVKKIPEQINESIGKKNYLAAAQLVVQAQDSLKGPLQSIEGLKEVRSDLSAKQEAKLKPLKFYFLSCSLIRFCETEILQVISGRFMPLHLRQGFQRCLAMETGC